MPIRDDHGNDHTAPHATPRPVWASVRRGLHRLCPACGRGPMLRGYLQVNDTCSCCGEELHHHRADDFPQYLTIFVVGHVLVAALLLTDELWPDLPMSVHYVVWPCLVVVLSLWLLPIFKSMLVAYQWALRMHGFETAHAVSRPTDTATDLESPTIRRRSAA